MSFPITVYQSILDPFLGFFGNIFNDIMLFMFLLIGLIIGIFFRPGWGNHVMKVLPREHRFVDFGIQEETAITIECDDKKGFPAHRFIKLAPGFVGTVGRFVKRQATRFIGKEGTAYTWTLQDDKYVKVGNLLTALTGLWGAEFCESIPDPYKGQLVDSKLMVTVDLDDGLTPPGMSSVSEEDIKREEDRRAAETFWQGKKDQLKGQWINMLIVGIAGFGIACLLQIIGILRVPTPTPETAKFIMALVQTVM